MRVRGAVRLGCLGIFLAFPLSSPAQWANFGGPGGCYVSALAANGGHLFAGTAFGIFVSTDAGGSWVPAREPGSAVLGAARINGLYVSGADLFALAGGALYLSRDNGASWAALSAGLPDNAGVTCLLDSGSVLYCGLLAGGVFRSADRGAHWQAALTEQPEYEDIRALAAIGQSLYARSGWNDLYRSTDCGVTWTAMDPEPPEDSGGGMLAAVGQSLFLAGGHGIFVYKDGGSAWTKVETGWAPDAELSFFAASGGDLLAVVDGKGYLSADSGAAWREIKIGPATADLEISCFAAVGTSLYAGVSASGLFRSEDAGASWAPVETGFPSQAKISAFVRMGTGLFTAVRAWGQTGRLFVQEEGNAGWGPLELALPEETTISCLAVAGSNLIAGTNNGLFLSDDRGRTWASVGPAQKAPIGDEEPEESGEDSGNRLVVYCFETVGTRVLAGTDDGLLLTEDRGRTWSRIVPPPSYSWAIECFARIGESLFAGGSGGLFVSRDGGETWKPAAMGTYSGRHVASLATDGNVLLAGIYPRDEDSARTEKDVIALSDLYAKFAILVSRDKGGSWKAATEGLPEEFRVGLLAAGGSGFVASLENTYTKGGRYSLGLFLSTDGGMTWTPDWPGRWSAEPINQFLFEKDGILAATDGAGIWRLPLAALKKRTP